MLRFELVPFGRSFHGGIRVAVGDVNGDGIPDIITAEGSGGTGLVRIFDGITGNQLAGPLGSFQPFGPDYTGGIYVAAGDVNGDGYADVVTSEGEGGEARVRVFSGPDGSLLADFLAFDAAFRGGVRVAAADVNHNGAADVVAAAGPGGPPLVKVVEGEDLLHGVTKPALAFNAFDSNFQGGVYVATGDVHGDGIPKIITGEGAGGQPRVSVFDGINGARLQTFLAFDGNFHGGVRVAAADVNGDGRSDIVVARGPGGPSLVRGFDGVSLKEIDQFQAFGPQFRDGVFVGGGGRWGIFNPHLLDDGVAPGLLPVDSDVGPLTESPLPLFAQSALGAPPRVRPSDVLKLPEMHAAAIAAFLDQPTLQAHSKVSTKPHQANKAGSLWSVDFLWEARSLWDGF